MNSKKILIATIILWLCSNYSFAAVYIVNNNTNAPVGHYNNLASTIDLAANGDTIYIVGSAQYYTANNPLTKQLTFIGPGYNTIKQDFVFAHVANFTLNVSASKSRFLGLYLNRILALNGAAVDSVEVAYCWFDGFESNPALRTGPAWYIHHNLFSLPVGAGAISFDGNASIVTNNVFGLSSTAIGAIHSPVSSILNNVSHNIFISSANSFAFQECYNALINDNIFYGVQPRSTAGTAAVANSTFTNNLSYGSVNDTIPNANNTLQGNLMGQQPLFLSGTPPSNYTWALTYDYKLTNNSPGHNYASDIGDIGHCGGYTPFTNYSDFPVIPIMREFDVLTPIVGTNAPIQIHLKATNK